MTHTLHRKGDADSLKEDYVLLVLTEENVNRDGSEDKIRQIWEVFSRNEKDLVNFGTAYAGNSHNTSIESIKKAAPPLAHAVFKDRNTLKACLKEIKDRDFGISIVVSGLYEDVEKLIREIGLTPHTVNLSLGIHGNTDRLPDESILDITTMCGHHMVSSNLVKEMGEKIKKEKMTHKEAAIELSKLCDCGIFNPYRAEKLLRKMTSKAK